MECIKENLSGYGSNSWPYRTVGEKRFCLLQDEAGMKGPAVGTLPTLAFKNFLLKIRRLSKSVVPP